MWYCYHLVRCIFFCLLIYFFKHLVALPIDLLNRRTSIFEALWIELPVRCRCWLNICGMSASVGSGLLYLSCLDNCWRSWNYLFVSLNLHKIQNACFVFLKDTGADADVFQDVDDSSCDREPYPTVRQSIDSIVTAQRSPMCRHESPNKPSMTCFQSPPHQPSIVGMHCPTDTHLSEWGVRLLLSYLFSQNSFSRV